MEIPLWLNTQFLAAAVGEGQDKDILVLEYDVTPAVPVGTNYLSCLYRVKLNYKRRNKEAIQSTSLIVKGPVISSFIKDFAEKLNVAVKETVFYNIILPEINGYLGNDRVSPKNYFSLRNDVLVLEDLNHQGYVMMDRIKQLDHEHCVSVMETLARFHASSMALHEANPQLLEKAAKEVLFAEGTGWYELQNKYIKDCYTMTANGLKTVKHYEKYGEIVLKEMDTAWNKLVRLFSKGKHIRVLNHGDVWTNNILFKHDKHGKVTDVKLVDFQMCRYASLGADIQFFLNSSVNTEVCGNGFGDLLEEYRKTLNATLTATNCKIQLSVEELEEEVKSAEPYAVFTLCTLLAIAMANPENPPKPSDNQEFLNTDGLQVNSLLEIYLSDRFLDLVVEGLKRLEKNGYFS